MEIEYKRLKSLLWEAFDKGSNNGSVFDFVAWLNELREFR